MCRCYSFENTFLLGVDAMAVVFNYGYDSLNQRGSSKGVGPKDPVGFLLAQGASRPWRVLPKGEVVRFTLEEALEALGTCLDCRDDRFAFYSNDLCEPEPANCPWPYSRAPVLRITGAVIDVRTEYYSHITLMPQDEAYQWIQDRYDPPYAVLVLRLVVDWTSRGSDSQVLLSTEDREEHRDTYRYGVVFRLPPATGGIAEVSLGVTIDSIVNIAVFLMLPGAITSVLVFWLLGNMSYLYRQVQSKIVSVEVLHKSLAYTSLIAEHNFQLLDSNSNGYIDRQELFDLFSGMLRKKLKATKPGMDEQWIDNRIHMLVDMLTCEHRSPTGGTVVGVSHQEFLRNATFNQPYTWDNLIDRMVEGRAEAYPGEQAAAALGQLVSKAATRTLRRRRNSPNLSPVVPVAPTPGHVEDEVLVRMTSVS